MISRVAGSCFWLHRYLERATNTARLLRVHRWFTLDIPVSEVERWHPLIIVAGEQARFAELHPGSEDDGEVVQEYLTWSDDNPASISVSLRWARENARTIREVVSPEMWEVLNAFHHWLRRGSGRRTWRSDRDAFYHHVQRMGDEFYGAALGTMLHEEPFDFMRLGAMLERANQTARILDVKHHLLGRMRGPTESALEIAEWTALLHCCSAVEPFQRRTRATATGLRVADFLLREPSFARSVYHCLDRGRNFLNRIRPRDRPEIGRRSAECLETLLAYLGDRSAEAIVAEGIHEVLTHVIDQVGELCALLEADFFEPDHELVRASGEASS